jgi:hypothetical protein
MEAMLDPDAQRAWRERAQRLVDARPWRVEEQALAGVYADVLAGGRRPTIRRWPAAAASARGDHVVARNWLAAGRLDVD